MWGHQTNARAHTQTHPLKSVKTGKVDWLVLYSEDLIRWMVRIRAYPASALITIITTVACVFRGDETDKHDATSQTCQRPADEHVWTDWFHVFSLSLGSKPEKDETVTVVTFQAWRLQLDKWSSVSEWSQTGMLSSGTAEWIHLKSCCKLHWEAKPF